MAVIVDADDVTHVRAEDESGAFGILPGHGDFLTALTISVISWRQQDGSERHVAVRGGVLVVRNGQQVEVASREAVDEATLGQLGPAVLERFQREVAAEAAARTSATRLQLATIRQFERYLSDQQLARTPSFFAAPDANERDRQP